MAKVIRFNITPQTNVRATQGDRIFFRIPRGKLFPSGLKRLLRLERCNEYKDSLRNAAKKLKFVIPEQGMSIKFYIPVPKSWRPWQKELMHGKLHQQKPDFDNLLKIFLDSLLTEDKKVGHISSVSKHWVNHENGWIDVILEKPTHEMMELPRKKPKIG